MKTKGDWKLPHRFLFCFVLFFSFLTFQQQKYFISQTPFTLPPFKNIAVSSSLYKKYAKSYCGYTFDCKNVDTHKSVSRVVSSFMDLVKRELLAREDWDEIKDAVGTTNMKKKRTRYLIVISWHVETMLHIMILGGLWNGLEYLRARSPSTEWKQPSSRKYERPTTWFRPKCK